MVLTDDTFEPYAMKHYTNDCCISMDEFYDDLKRVRYIRALVRRYAASNDLRERLILNHLIALGNVFSIEAVVKMVLFKLEESEYSIIKPFLDYLNFMPKIVYDVAGKDIWSSEIREDKYVIKKLKEI